MRSRLPIGGVLLCCVVVGAFAAPRLRGQASQTSSQKGPTFEVASIKRTTAIERGGGKAGLQAGGRFVMTNGPTRVLINMAYPSLTREISGASDWVTYENYDVEARASGEVSDEQLALLLRDLLSDRFKLMAHFETRVRPIYELRVLRNDREAQARFELYRLRSMSSVLGEIPFRRGNTDPYAGWIREHQDAARYNEPGGQWMIDPSYIKGVHEKHRDTAAADDIAWLFVVNGKYGECEGDIPCYVDWRNQLNGWYLQSHPRGRHTDESNADIALKLNGAMDNLLRFPLVLGEFNPAARCGELHMSIDPLTAAVTASVSARRADALAAIERYAQLCR